MRTSTIVEAPSSPQTANKFITFPFSLVWYAILVLAISVLASHRVSDTDIWVHLRNARELVTTHALVRFDRYTFTSAGAPLINFEWLSELPYFAAFQLWGLRGLLGVYLVLVCVAFGGAYYLALRRGADCADAALVTIAAALVGTYSFGPRMFHFGWACLIAVILVLERFERTGRGLSMLPLVFALWVNLHASWVFGFVVLAIYGGCGLVQGHWNNVVAERWPRAQLRRLAIACAASFAALFVNPYGYKLVLYPFELLSRQRAVRDELTEWQSVDFHTLWGKLALLMLVGLLAAAWFSPLPWKLRDVVLATFAVWTAFTHIRFLLFAALILVPILAPRVRLLAPEGVQRPKPWFNLLVTAAILALVIWSYPTNAQLQEAIDSQFPTRALLFLQENAVDGRLFHYYGYGGYIEWYAPQIKTFADPRTDLFVYNGVLADYLQINAIDKTFELFDKYKINYVLFPINTRLTYLLAHSSDWQRIYDDHVVEIYKRK